MLSHNAELEFDIIIVGYNYTHRMGKIMKNELNKIMKNELNSMTGMAGYD